MGIAFAVLLPLALCKCLLKSCCSDDDDKNSANAQAERRRRRQTAAAVAAASAASAAAAAAAQEASRAANQALSMPTVQMMMPEAPHASMATSDAASASDLEEFRGWLEGVGQAAYLEKLAALGASCADDLELLEVQDLVSAGLPVVPAKKIIRAVGESKA